VSDSGFTTGARRQQSPTAQVDKIILLNCIKTGTNREYVHYFIDIIEV